MNGERVLCWTIIGWLVGVFLIMALAGCSRSTPTSEINQQIQDEVAQLVDYANNNMEMDADKQLLINGARHCAMRAGDLEKVCAQTVSAYRTETAAWKLATTLISIIAVFLGIAWIKK